MPFHEQQPPVYTACVELQHPQPIYMRVQRWLKEHSAQDMWLSQTEEELLPSQASRIKFEEPHTKRKSVGQRHPRPPGSPYDQANPRLLEEPWPQSFLDGNDGIEDRRTNATHRILHAVANISRSIVKGIRKWFGGR
ncbi:uncharacterized protein BDZ99DRAFT_468062 [Mytilinidion resinicola]|uniref:Uncharacterized protein n=1 Tax=Mytilinidion resinicola TaxID=574789 RepID=A0A6A6Y3U7_9PEZI|nr:uncharacterized protein BDZ99DRAFT_468062 [Mytilinidion resinicola]KAF2803511.1 hypothetical protein BDZ99DRAFT_468062 [Mytilinidion resinicola]